MPPTPHSPIKARGPGRPRLHADEADSGDVRERLLQAATELAVEHGFEACGLREIAAAAEVSPGMIAYYFGDRNGLYEAMFERAFDRVGRQVRTLLEADDGLSGGDRLDELVRLQVAAIAADPWLPKLIVREVLARDDTPMRAHLAETVGQGPLTLMVRWLEEEQSRGVLRADFDPKLMAITLASLAAFPFLMGPIVGDEIGLVMDDDFPDRLIEHNQKFLAHGLRARTEKDR